MIKDKRDIKIVDLFCGVGGLTCGLTKSGLSVVAGLDNDGSCQYAYEANNKARFIQADVSNFDSQEIIKLYENAEIKILVGCAPCQTFSKQTNKYKERIHDKKWTLLQSFTAHINNVKPDIKVGTDLSSELPIKGFIATVKLPSNKKMRGVDENLTIDLFVNGRIREKDILRHISSNRIYESYVYGQIHFDVLDDENDRFTSSREGIKSNDEEFKKLLVELKTKIMPKVIDDWDKIRLNLREDGDIENPRKTPKQRKAASFFNTIADEYTKDTGSSSSNKNEENIDSDNKDNGDEENVESISDKIKEWVDALRDDAAFNFESYAECFISENLLRNYIKEKQIQLDEEMVKKAKEDTSRTQNDGGINIEIRKDASDESYLYMKDLAKSIDKPNNTKGVNQNITLVNKTKEYNPMRNAIMHTNLITDEAKLRLTTVLDDIKARLKNIFYSA